MVSAECVIGNIMRFMGHYDNNDSVTVMKVKSVMFSENDLHCLYWETGKFQLYVFSYGTKMPAWKENCSVYGHLRYAKT
jgi:hypothetical protein